MKVLMVALFQDGPKCQERTKKRYEGSSFPRGTRCTNRGSPATHGGAGGRDPAGSALFRVWHGQAHLHSRTEERCAAGDYGPRNCRDRLRNWVGSEQWASHRPIGCDGDGGGMREVCLLPAQTIQPLRFF